MGLTARYEAAHYSLRPAALRDVSGRTDDERQQEYLVAQWLLLSLSQRAQKKLDYRGRLMVTAVP